MFIFSVSFERGWLEIEQDVTYFENKIAFEIEIEIGRLVSFVVKMLNIP